MQFWTFRKCENIAGIMIIISVTSSFHMNEAVRTTQAWMNTKVFPVPKQKSCQVLQITSFFETLQAVIMRTSFFTACIIYRSVSGVKGNKTTHPNSLMRQLTFPAKPALVFILFFFHFIQDLNFLPKKKKWRKAFRPFYRAAVVQH